MTGSNAPWPVGPQAPVFFQGWHPFATDQLAAGFAGAGGAGVIRLPAFPDMDSLSRRLSGLCHSGNQVGLDLRGVLGEFSARLDSAAHNLATFLIHESDLMPERLEALRAWGLPRVVVVRDGEAYHIFYEKPRGIGSAIFRRESRDLLTWSDEKLALAPQFKWEKTLLGTNGNPCVVRHEGQWRLYFSASVIFLRDCLFFEPRHIGVAESDSIEGPWVKRPEPLISPSPDVYWRNFGAGSIKVLSPVETGEPLWWAFTNGIYHDAEGRSRSEIWKMKSPDGYAWEPVGAGPIFAPSNAADWKRALVYAMHVIKVEGRWRMYYNARDGWFIGKERIGLGLEV